MQQNPRFLFLFFFLVSLVVFLPLILSEARQLNLVGEWAPIHNIDDPHVKEIAEFAVNEYNKQSKKSLRLEKVVKGETQVVSGMNYKLVLRVEQMMTQAIYEAVVWEKAGGESKTLTSFKLLQFWI